MLTAVHINSSTFIEKSRLKLPPLRASLVRTLSNRSRCISEVALSIPLRIHQISEVYCLLASINNLISENKFQEIFCDFEKCRWGDDAHITDTGLQNMTLEYKFLTI